MKLAVTLLALLVACRATADELPNGIYSVADNDAQTGTMVTRADTHDSIKLQKLIASGFGTPSLVSISNDNENFRLELSKAGPFRENFETAHQAVYIDGVCVPLWSREEFDSQRKSTVIGTFTSLENARKIAKSLSIEPKLRRHPGHKVLVKWVPTQISFKPSEPIELTLKVENVGDAEVNFVAGGSQRGSRDNQFAFIAHGEHGYGKAVPDTGDPTNFGGIGSFANLKPGDSFTKTVDVSKWFRFTESGSYQLTCIYHIEMSSGDKDLWDDFLTGRCIVRIKK